MIAGAVVSIVDRWIGLIDSYCFDHLVLLIFVAFHVVSYFLKIPLFYLRSIFHKNFNSF